MSVRSRLRRVLQVPKATVRTVPVPEFVAADQLLTDRVALITGGAGGIGRAVAEHFAAAGARVILVGRDTKKLSAAVAQIGPSASQLVMDLREPATFPGCLDGLDPFPDILVNCAGLLSTQPFGQIDVAEYDRVMDTNVRAVLFLTQEVSRRWVTQGRPANVLNISSGSQFKPGWTPYQVSKNALDALTTGMASFLISEDIVVNAIAPGPVATSMLGLDCADLTFLSNPTERAITPGEVAQWCVWLVSGYGRYAVGSTFAITGGNGLFHWERQNQFGSGRPRKKHLHQAK